MKLPVREHHAPVGALRLCSSLRVSASSEVREHHAPVGALRPADGISSDARHDGQGAPRTCRCIETSPWRTVSRGSSARQGAPRTCRCIETSLAVSSSSLYISQGAPRTGALRQLDGDTSSKALHGQGAPRTCRCIELFSPGVVVRGRCGGCCLLRSSGGAEFSNGGVPRPHRRARWARIGFGGGYPGEKPFPGGTGSSGDASLSVVAPVTSWGSVQRPRGPRGRPRRTSATPLSLYYALSPSATLLFPVQQRVKRRSKEKRA